MYEPETGLTQLYFNHAHNDLLEIMIEGGLFCMVLLFIFLFWFALRTIGSWRSGQRGGEGSDHARLGSILAAMVLTSSLADYALRTPMMSVVMVIALSWLRPAPRPAEAQEIKR
jgi:O-antigen ligase